MGWIDSVSSYLGLSPTTLSRLLATLGIILALWLLRWASGWMISRRIEDPKLAYRWRKATSLAILILGVLLVGRVWLEGMQAVATYLGLLSAGVAVALRDPLVNLFGWVYIGWRKPFSLGDRVTVEGVTGDVIDIGAFSFALLEVGAWVTADQSTGRIVHIPNGKVFTAPVINYTQGFDYIWHEIPITITFESDWRKAKEKLLEIVHRHAAKFSDEAAHWIRHASKRFLITYASLTPTVYTKIVENGVQLTIRYLTPSRKRRDTEHAICEDILKEFAKFPDVDFAYPTWRVFDQKSEGKPALRSGGGTPT